MSKEILNKTKKSRKTRAPGVLTVNDIRTDSFSCKQSVALYRFVYASRTSVLVAFLLFVSFFVQGVQNVYASEDFQTTTVETVVPNTPVAEEVTDTVAEEEVDVPDSVSETETAIEQADSEIDVEPEVNNLPNGSATSTSVDTSTSTNQQQGEVATSTEPVDNTGNSVDDVVINESDDFSTEEVIEAPLTHETVSFSESDSAFSFTSDECTQLATGSFYCQKPQKNILEDALFSAPDEDGDTEIFLVKAGVQVQITHNKVDDEAPYYDQNSNTIVWHRLVNDRFQIISYDVDKQEETQMTQTSENNMEPTRQGSYTVWQRWVDGGWNIVMNDGSKETQITRTSSHNVAPYIHGSLIVWNRHDVNGEKTIEMYDISSRTYVTVNDPDGMAVSNPRMVFVYDSLHPNGDIVTKGYDVLAHKFIDLGTLPRDLPDELPDSDSTGETRALIQSKPSIKYEVVESVSGSTTPPVVDIPVDLVNSTTSDDIPEPELVEGSDIEQLIDSPVTIVEVEEPFVDSLIDSQLGTEQVPEIEEFVMPVEETAATTSVQE